MGTGPAAMRWTRVVVGGLLVVSGALMYAASWQRWASACPFDGIRDTRACELRQDHLYEFVAPSDPWTPIGTSAQLAGWSLLLLAAALLVLPLALTGGRVAVGWLLAAAATAVAFADIGQATLRSGLLGRAVPALTIDVAFVWWFLVPTVALVWLVVVTRGWSRAAGTLVLLGSPGVAAFTYAIGPFDANPWWEAWSGAFTGLGGHCLVVAAAWRPARQSREEVRTSPATPVEVL